MNIESLKPGQVVYDVHRHKMGNTTISSVGVWSVRIIEVNAADKWVLASWNGNEPKKYYGRKFSWRKTKPFLVKEAFGSHRLATREEIKAAKEKADAK